MKEDPNDKSSFSQTSPSESGHTEYAASKAKGLSSTCPDGPSQQAAGTNWAQETVGRTSRSGTSADLPPGGAECIREHTNDHKTAKRPGQLRCLMICVWGGGVTAPRGLALSGVTQGWLLRAPLVGGFKAPPDQCLLLRRRRLNECKKT